MASQNADMHGVFLITDITVDPSSLATDAIADNQVTVAGLLSTDIVVAIPPADLEAGLVVQSTRVSAANTIQIRIQNVSAGTVNGASKATWSLLVFRR